MNGYEVYRLYLALKMHFSDKNNYDFFKYRGEIKYVTESSYLKRKDKYFFHKLSKRLKDEEVIPFLVSNFLVNSNAWIKTMCDPSGNTIFKLYQCKMESLEYTFEQDLIKIQIQNTDITKTIMPGESYPELLSMFFAKDITLETLCIIHLMTGCINKWDDHYKDDYIYEKWSQKTRRYIPFINIDLNDMKTIAKKVLTS